MKNTSKIEVPLWQFKQVEQAIKQSGVKFYPFRRIGTRYEIEFEPQNHPLVSFLLLKYEGVKVEND